MGELGTDAREKQKFLSVEPGDSVEVKIPAGDKFWKAIVNKFGTNSYRYKVIVDGVTKDWDCSSTSVALAIDKMKEDAKGGEISFVIKRTIKNEEGKTKWTVEKDIPF